MGWFPLNPCPPMVYPKVFSTHESEWQELGKMMPEYSVSLGRPLSNTEIITIAVIAALVLVAIIFAGATCAVRRKNQKNEVLQPLLGESYPRYAEDKENTQAV